MSGETFEALLASNLPAVRKLVHTRLRMPDQADDIIQQTLLRAFARRDQLRVRAKFKSWLWSIALNEIRMFFRRDRHTVSLEEFPHIDSRDRGLSPLARFEQIERRDWLQAAMAKLSERDRAAIRLRDLDELSLSETAEALERSEAAAKSTHFRARQRLACALREVPGPENSERRETQASLPQGIRGRMTVRVTLRLPSAGGVGKR
ncbi:MAG TPA: sigma-70 family RNA polymerase sigma factor [Bryobacteraceae bacterium]|nr:sigma-70 family RNA polymerase sigma factor [Bryobacteraceae bacterium]